VDIRAAIFDLGVVVVGSPLHAIAAYERHLGAACRRGEPSSHLAHPVTPQGPVRFFVRFLRA
jgi:hypothetical protein